MSAQLIYALLWISFGLVHSLLTLGSVKRTLEPWLSYRYRIIYNLVSALHIGVIMYVGRKLFHRAEYVVFSDWQHNVLVAIGLTGIFVMLLSLREYDLGLFSGLKQWRLGRMGKIQDTLEPLSTQGFHRFVRHPLYTGAFLILWGGAESMYGLMTAVWGSAYLLIGTHFEERKLIGLYGDKYRHYRATVPLYVPWKGRVG